ncbi:MAG TPA: carboxypeptidase-like regulatory domain-containing protein [Terracidiphilus sp.]|nr:carboxypeptidase-like regulatory domain-containing protein [Terracidiphilus sp.]
MRFPLCVSDRLRLILSGGAVLALLLAGWSSPLSAQLTPKSRPDAPGFDSPAIPAQDAAGSPTQPANPATISGTILDTNGDVLQGAHVVLVGPVRQRALDSGPDGQFTFSGLPPGNYRIKITGTSVSPFESPVIVLHPGEAHFMPNVVLALTAGVTAVHVSASQDTQVQIAEAEMHIEESQRVLGVIPNFYSAYDWNTPSLNARQKFSLAFRSEIDPITFVGAAAVAGAEEYQNMYPGYGTGFSGFGKRFGAQYANDMGSRMIGSAVLPSLFHQDPRYFYKGTGSTRSRAFYAIKSAFICRGDNGHDEFDFSHILGDFAAGGLANIYYPEPNEGVGLIATNALIEIGGMAGTNLLREFVLPGFTTHGPGHHDTLPPTHPGQGHFGHFIHHR